MSKNTLTKPSLAEPTPAASTVLAFAEGVPKSTTPNADKRIFYAPEGFRRLTVNLPEDLHKQMRLAAIERDSHPCPYPAISTDSWSWSSGRIEGLAAPLIDLRAESGAAQMWA